MWCSALRQPRQDRHGLIGGVAPACDEAVARGLLRWEGLAALVVALSVYQAQGYAWSSFAAWVLLPDVALLAYLTPSARLGMWAYNCTHSTVGPAALAACALALGNEPGVQAALIWFAHIGFDRALGYGLKGAHGFNQTHLGWIGRGQP